MTRLPSHHQGFNYCWAYHRDAPWGSTRRVKSGEVAKAQTGSCRRLGCLMWTQRWGGRHSAWMKSVPIWVRTVRGEVPGSSEVGIRVYSDQRRVWWGKWLSYLLPRMKRWIAASFHLCYLTETGGLQTQEGSFIYTEQPCWLQHSHFITCFSLYCDFGVNPNAYCWCQQYFNPI